MAADDAKASGNPRITHYGEGLPGLTNFRSIEPKRKRVPVNLHTRYSSHNPTGIYEGSSRETIERFKSVLERARIPATVRLTRGRDIEAACGQLAAARRCVP